MDTSDEFLLALETAQRYKSEENLEPITGFLRYTGRSKTDQQYQHTFNFIISLQLQILEKLNQLSEKVDKLIRDKGISSPTVEVGDEIDKLTEAINKFHVSEKGESRNIVPEKYKFWTVKKEEEHGQTSTS